MELAADEGEERMWDQKANRTNKQTKTFQMKEQNKQFVPSLKGVKLFVNSKCYYGDYLNSADVKVQHPMHSFQLNFLLV